MAKLRHDWKVLPHGPTRSIGDRILTVAANGSFRLTAT
jgi:hypothetical protein